MSTEQSNAMARVHGGRWHGLKGHPEYTEYPHHLLLMKIASA